MGDPSPPPPPPPPEFPPVDPTNFDLIVLGTSLSSSILAAAASSVSKTVLHLDPNPFYGSHFSSLSPPDLSSFVLSPSLSSTSSTSDQYDAVPLSTHSLYSDISIDPLPNDLQTHVRKLSLDMSGPRVLFCADKLIELLLKSGVSQYMEFKSVDQSFIYDEESKRLVSVPDSRGAIFKDKSLLLTEKNQLMRFFKLVQHHLDGDSQISDEDLESPFSEFLTKMRLPKKIQRIILYAIALADYDQEKIEVCKDLLKTKNGIDRLALYHSSIGRFPNAQGAMLYPMYGQGELPQAFCRRAAVKGCIYVLRMPVAALLVDKDSGLYKGVRLDSGQDIFSQNLVIDPHLVVPRALGLSTLDNPETSSECFSPSDTKKKVARGIFITRTSLKSDVSNLLIVCPPKSLSSEQATSVRALQLSSNTAVCPSGMFVVHLSALCDDASQEDIFAAMNSLFRQPTEDAEAEFAENLENNSVAESATPKEQRPVYVWRAFYIQEVTEGSVHTISTTPSPDENLSYNDLVPVTQKMFQQMFPGEEFFLEEASSDDAEDNEGVDLE